VRGRNVPERSRRKVRSVTPGGAHYHCNNSGNVRSFTSGALLMRKLQESRLECGKATSLP